MKNISKAKLLINFKFLFLSLISLYMFWGCGVVSEEAFVFEKTKYVYISLSLNIDKAAGLSASSDGARTILPIAIDLTDTSRYDFYIWGKSNKGSVSPRKVNFSSSSSSTGTIDLDFPISTYTFVLAATEGTPSDTSSGSAILAKSVLVGYTNADLNYSTNIKFYLAPSQVNGYGDINLSLKLDDSWSDTDATELISDYYATVGLYDINTGEEAFSSAVQYFYGLNKTSSLPYVRTDVSSGTYNFTVKIFKSASSIVYNYSDRLVVYPNQTINEDVLIPNIVEKVPAAPTNFKAAYCIDYRLYKAATVIWNDDGTYTTRSDIRLESNEDIAKYNINGYGLLLSWDDNSNNESYFRVTLANISKTNTPVGEVPAPETFTDLNWTMIVGPYAGNTNVVKVYDDTYTRSDEYLGGSPEKNNSSMILYLPFDGCYIAKIEAVNDAGSSKACYATIDESTTARVVDSYYALGYVDYTGLPFRTADNPTCNVINLYHVLYYLCGGEYSYNRNSSTVTKTDTIAEYGVYGMTKTFLCPYSSYSDATEENPALIYKSYDPNLYNKRWKRWKVGSYGDGGYNLAGQETTALDGHSYIKPDDYTGYTSLYLFARYD